jgi:hypothetical protein
MKNSILKFTFATCMIFMANLYSQNPNTENPNLIKSAFDPKSAEWQIAWPGRISQYDLVYNSPPKDALQGIPLGNGETGVLVWCESSKIIMVVNKSDLWDDSRTGSPDSWSERDDYYTTLRHGARIIIEFKFPIFETMYLSEFHARLSLADATLMLETTSPFGKVNLKAFVDHQSGVFCYDLATDFKEDIPLEIILERFGSRTYSMWYTRVERDAAIGLDGTESFASDRTVYLTQKLLNGSFAIGGSVINSNDLTVTYRRVHARSSLISLNGSGRKEAQLAFAVTSPVTNPVLDLKETLSHVEKTGIQALYVTHAESWKSIWNRSFMDYGDTYLNNLWHLTMYYANASQGGTYPGRFTNGLWGWSHDVQNWNFYFHWNQQQIYWPLNAAGYHDRIDSYLNFRFNSLSYAKMEANKYFNTDGAYISDITNRKGYNSPDIRHNHTPVAEIALDFWRQYQYTCDENFLKEKALPFMLEAARFFDSLFFKEADGKYHVIEGTGYEGWIRLKDGLTELVYARVLFSATLEALEIAGFKAPESAKWKKMLTNFAPLPVVKADEGLIRKEDFGYKINQGLFKGSTTPSDEIMAAGWGIEEKRWLTTHYSKDNTWVAGVNAQKGEGVFSASNDLLFLNGIFPAVPSSPVYPSGLIGLSEKKSRLYDAMKTTVLLIGPEVMGWDPVPIVMSRLGMAEELELILKRYPERWQIYCNGWGHISPEQDTRDEAANFFRTNIVRDRNMPVETADRFPSPMWPFRHMSMESMSVLATAMNEALLQSYEGILRIAPAIPSDKSGRFTLHAVGGFIISSEIRSGEIQWICIESSAGKTCCLQLPWKKAEANSDLKGHVLLSGEIAEIQTHRGEVVIITPVGKSPDTWLQLSENPGQNQDIRYHPSGKSQLGIPRMY